MGRIVGENNLDIGFRAKQSGQRRILGEKWM